jgi:signal transduction histidine kinase
MSAASAGAASAGSAPSQATRGQRWAWTLLALVVLAISLWGAWTQRRRGSVPEGLDASALPYPVVVEGVLVGGPDELELKALAKAAGERLDLRPSAPPVLLVHEVSALAMALTLLSALFYAGTCLLVLARRAHLAAARDLSRAMCCACLAISVGGVYPPAAPGEALLLVAFVLGLSLMPLEFLLLTSDFPVRSGWLARRPWQPWALRALGLGVAGWNALAWLAYVRAPDPERYGAARLAYGAMEALLVGGMALGCAALFRASRRAAWARERAQARWLLWGIFVVSTPFVFLRTLPRLLGLGEASIPPELDRIVELAAPAAFALAVVRHRVFDIDAIIRRSLIASALALLLAGAALGVLLACGSLCPDPVPLPREAVWLVAGAVTAALFGPARRAVGRWVDRTFFRIRHEHGLALRALAGPLAQAAAPEAVARLVERECASELDPASVALWLTEGREDGSTALDGLARLDLGDGIARARPGATTMAELEGSGFPAALLGEGVVLLQPLARQGRLWGVLLLGPKQAGQRYVEEDLTFLTGLAAEAAQALERLSLVRTLAAESSARAALATLDRQRRDFLLRVAHDLRTPLTAVRWSAANLKDGLSGELSEGQGEEVVGILAASGQLARLVDNLVALSRMELQGPTALEPVPLAPLVTETLAALKPVAQAKGVRLDARLEGAAPARGRRDALGQVVQNLVDNAVKYAPPGSAVEITLAPDAAAPGRRVCLSVRDHGPGLRGKDPRTLFDLFRQGAASPHASAQGLGVGLHVVKSWVEAFGGSVEGGDHPEGGAVFTCRMACWASDGGSA